MNITQFNKELFDYIKTNNLEEFKDFPSLALYQFIQESGLKTVSELIVKSSNEATLDIIDPRKYTAYKSVLKSDKISIEENGTSYSDYQNIVTDKEKKFDLSMYETIQQANNLENLIQRINNLTLEESFDEHDFMFSNDASLRGLDTFISAYNTYKEHKETTNIAVSQLFAIARTIPKHSMQDFDPLKRVLQDYVLNDLDLKANIPVLLLVDRLHIAAKTVRKNENILDSINIEGSYLSTLLKNKDRHSIIEEVFNEHLLKDLKELCAFKSRLLSRCKTFEQKLDFPHIKNFLNELMIKYPYSFENNELGGFKSGVYQSTDLQHNRTISQFINKFKLIEDVDKYYTDINFDNRKESFLIDHENKDIIRLIGETDNIVKYVITGNVISFSSQLKAFEVDGLNMLKNDSFYNKIGFEQLFNYCKDNQLALIIRTTSLTKKLENTFDIFSNIKEAYKDTVFSICDPTERFKTRILEHTSLDYDTFMKHHETITEKCRASFVDSESLYGFEQNLVKKKFKH